MKNNDGSIQEGDIFEVGDGSFMARMVVLARENGDVELAKFDETGFQGEVVESEDRVYKMRFVGNVMGPMGTKV